MLPLARDGYGDTTDPPPSSGTGLIIAGWILTGVGVLNLALIPACCADFYPTEAEDSCIVLSAVIGGIGVALGVPFLIIGYNQRSNYKDWSRRNSTLRHLLNTRLAFKGRLRAAALPSGVVINRRIPARTARCEESACAAVVQIGDRCFAAFDSLDTETYDCALDDNEILDRARTARDAGAASQSDVGVGSFGGEVSFDAFPDAPRRDGGADDFDAAIEH